MIISQRQTSYFLIYAIIGMIAVLVGFGITYLVPMGQGKFEAPISVHIHGTFAFAWISLYLMQTLLIKRRNYKLHMSLGYASIIILIGFFISHYYALGYVIERDLPVRGEDIYGSCFVSLTSAALILILGMAGLYYRKSPEVHKRLMFLATVLILWPAWGRWRHYFPDFEYQGWWFQYIIPYSFILWACIWEKVKFGQIHPVLLGVGAFLVLEGFAAGFYEEWPLIGQFVKWLYT